MEFSYPSPGFYFQVKIGTEAYSFKEVSGISFTANYEEIKSGGEDGYPYKAFQRMNYSNLELKRGFIAKDSLLGKFVKSSGEISGVPMEPISKIHPLIVNLLDEDAEPSFSWIFYNPILIGWKIGAFDSMKNDYLTESITLSYTHFEPA